MLELLPIPHPLLCPLPWGVGPWRGSLCPMLPPSPPVCQSASEGTQPETAPGHIHPGPALGRTVPESSGTEWELTGSHLGHWHPPEQRGPLSFAHKEYSDLAEPQKQDRRSEKSGWLLEFLSAGWNNSVYLIRLRFSPCSALSQSPSSCVEVTGLYGSRDNLERISFPAVSGNQSLGWTRVWV